MRVSNMVRRGRPGRLVSMESNSGVAQFTPVFLRGMELPQFVRCRRLPRGAAAPGRVNTLHVFEAATQHFGQADFLFGGNALGFAIELVRELDLGANYDVESTLV